MTRLKDLSLKTGFSITTISRALAGYDDVNEQTRQQIIRAAQEMGYQPNEVARQLRAQRTQTIGLIIPTHDQPFSEGFFDQLMRGIGDAAGESRFDVLVSARAAGDDEMESYKRIVGGNRVDGLILARTRHHDERIAYLRKAKMPFVVSGRAAPDEATDFPFIDVDSQAGIQHATAHLIALGHTRIGLVLPPPEIAYTEFRHRGYADALAAAGIPYDAGLVLHGDLMRSGGAACMRHFIETQAGLTAVVCSNDLMALGAMQAAQGRGYRIGHDMAIVGFDDLPISEHANPPLTTVRQPIYDIGRRLVELLLPIILGRPPQETQILLPTQLIVRESCGASSSRKGDWPSA
ncbi:MAG: LacI family transcriptional regulator [Pleurocapsa minor GSE-CHR-MK-17-07R]|jgi:LacI family transcriptional regulator|nr:LacI family transcriptional regulator [Pleurocapsa minor GSE-CHR-MK 17-07R]